MICPTCSGKGVKMVGYASFDTGSAVLSSLTPEFDTCPMCNGEGVVADGDLASTG